MNSFYIEFLEKCLRDGKYEIALSRRMSPNEMDYYHSVHMGISVGDFDIDAEQRLDLTMIYDNLMELKKEVTGAAIFRYQMEMDISSCKLAYHILYSDNGRLSILETLRRGRVEKKVSRDVKEMFTKTGVGSLNGFMDLATESLQHERHCKTSHLEMINISIEKSLKSMAVEIFGESGNLFPSEAECDIFHNLDGSYLNCKRMLDLSDKISKFRAFSSDVFYSLKPLLFELESIRTELVTKGAVSRDLLFKLYNVFCDLDSKVSSIAGINIERLFSEFRVVKDFHSERIVQQQAF